MHRVPKKKPLECGDEVYRLDSKTKAVWVITCLYADSADICMKGTDLEWFRYPLENLVRV